MTTLTPIINGSLVTAELLAEKTGSRAAPECPTRACPYAVPAGCALPVCRERWPLSPIRLARWATGRMVADHIMQYEPGTFDEVRNRLGLTPRLFTASLLAYEQDGTDWMIVHAQDGPSIPITWADNRLVGRCGRCGGTILVSESGSQIKCSMCGRTSPVSA